jgi:hypothetical protein
LILIIMSAFISSSSFSSIKLSSNFGSSKY